MDFGSYKYVSSALNGKNQKRGNLLASVVLGHGSNALLAFVTRYKLRMGGIHLHVSCGRVGIHLADFPCEGC
jgi:hypothetical protein